MVIGANVAVEKPEFSVFDEPVSVLQVTGTAAHRFHFRSGQDDPGLEFFEQEVVVAGVPVDSGVLFSRSGGLSAGIFLAIGLDLVGGLLGHDSKVKVSEAGLRG